MGMSREAKRAQVKEFASFDLLLRAFSDLCRAFKAIMPLLGWRIFFAQAYLIACFF
jgi:hypothetical protein